MASSIYAILNNFYLNYCSPKTRKSGYPNIRLRQKNIRKISSESILDLIFIPPKPILFKSRPSIWEEKKNMFKNKIVSHSFCFVWLIRTFFKIEFFTPKAVREYL